MSDERKCPKCGEDVFLVDPAEEDLNVEDYEEDAEVWLCVSCNWNEEADPDEAFEEHIRELEWISDKIAQIQATKGAQA